MNVLLGPHEGKLEVASGAKVAFVHQQRDQIVQSDGALVVRLGVASGTQSNCPSNRRGMCRSWTFFKTGGIVALANTGSSNVDVAAAVDIDGVGSVENIAVLGVSNQRRGQHLHRWTLIGRGLSVGWGLIPESPVSRQGMIFGSSLSALQLGSLCGLCLPFQWGLDFLSLVSQMPNGGVVVPLLLEQILQKLCKIQCALGVGGNCL